MGVVVVIKVKPVPVVKERSIRKAVSFVELSVHVKLIAVVDVAAAIKPEGATIGVVAFASELYAELPPAFVARIR